MNVSSNEEVEQQEKEQNQCLKRYYEMLYPAELKENEYVCLFFVRTDNEGNTQVDDYGNEIKFHKYVKNYNEYAECVNRYKYNFHVYSTLATVKKDKDGELHRKAVNIRQQRVLFIDYDKKDYPNLTEAQEFTKLIKDKLPGLFLHALYDSGHGFHFYVSIPPTCKVREISSLNKEICELVGADTNACKVTQVARVPGTYNRKRLDENGHFPMVKEVCHYQNNIFTAMNYHPCNIEMIKRSIADYKKNLNESTEQELQEWDYDSDGYDMPKYKCFCAEKVFNEGAEEHERNIWLGRIIVWLEREGYIKAKIIEKCLEWNKRCRPPKTEKEIMDEITGWYTWFYEHGRAKIGGCYWTINDDTRVRKIVEKQCNKAYCSQINNGYDSINIVEDIGVSMNQKVLTNTRLSNKGKNKMTGNEYLILTVLDKYMPKTGRTPFTVKDLKYRMLWKKSGKWQLCMDIETFKKTLESLEEHKCLTLTDPAPSQCKNNKITYDDKVIKLSKRLRDVTSENSIIFYYAVARALICHQITQNEYKVYLCLLNHMKERKSCTLDSMDNTLNMGKEHILRALQELEKASLIKVNRVYNDDKGTKHNKYYMTNTNKWDEFTDIELDEEAARLWNISLIV